MASTFGMISCFSRLRSSSVFDTGTSRNGDQMSSSVSPLLQPLVVVGDLRSGSHQECWFDELMGGPRRPTRSAARRLR